MPQNTTRTLNSLAPEQFGKSSYSTHISDAYRHAPQAHAAILCNERTDLIRQAWHPRSQARKMLL